MQYIIYIKTTCNICKQRPDNNIIVYTKARRKLFINIKCKLTSEVILHNGTASYLASRSGHLL